MSVIDSSSPEDLALLASIIAISLAKGRTNDEVNIIGSILSAIGDTLSIIATQRERVDSLKEKKQQFKDLKKELKR